jgi:hypothetical protein
MLNQVKKYIDENKKKPSTNKCNNKIKQYSLWINTQQKNYKKKDKIMKTKEIYDEWTKFVEEYAEYFLDNNELWYGMLNKIKKYINENQKRPSQHNKNTEIIQLSKWIGTQQKSYKNKEHIMKNKEIYDAWTKFINDANHKIYFMNNTELWYINFNKVKKYIDDNHNKPSQHNKDKEIKYIGQWILDQQKKYKKKNK